MLNKIKNFLPLLAFSLIPTLLIWLPFTLRLKSFWTIPLSQSGMATIVANYDGPLYLVIAKTLYNAEAIKQLFSFPLTTEYYAAHFPFFPLVIKPFAFILGFPYSMLFVTLTCSLLSFYFFNKLARLYVSKIEALWLTFVFSIFPARWLIVRSVGSAEPLFLTGIIASVYFFQQKKYFSAGIWGAIAALTKPPGILLFIAYFAAIFLPDIKKLGTQDFGLWVKNLSLKKYLSLLLIPLATLIVFIFYKIRFNDFLAYFHSGDNIHIFFPPFSIFNYSAPWVGTFWLEEIIFIYLLACLGLINLVKRGEKNLACFVCVFFVSILFVSHRDLIRYSLPLVPFLIIAFSETLLKKEFKIVLAFLAIPIYLFSLSYISQNVMPISDWAPFL